MAAEGIPASRTSESKQTSLTETSDPDLKQEVLQQPEAAENENGNVKDGLNATEKEATGNPEEDEMEYPHGLKLVIILAALCLAVFLVALDQTIISTAIPTITNQFNSITDIGWYGSSYLLTATALQPTFGRIYTIFSVSHSLPSNTYLGS